MRWFHDLARAIALCCAAASLNAAEIKLKDGRVLKGTVAEVTGVAEQPNVASTLPAQVVLIDSGLTRYLHRPAADREHRSGRRRPRGTVQDRPAGPGGRGPDQLGRADHQHHAVR